jgi:hypothetical protein
MTIQEKPPMSPLTIAEAICREIAKEASKVEGHEGDTIWIAGTFAKYYSFSVDWLGKGNPISGLVDAISEQRSAKTL